MTSIKNTVSRFLFSGAFITGLAAVGWVASGFISGNTLALTVTLLIGCVYLVGALELRRYGQKTTALNNALREVLQPLPLLTDWLSRVPESLRHAVHHRIESGRGAFPAPALTPYLIGLLVMLGMLGTFLGMVMTFQGAVFALEGSTDLNTVRSALAAPIKGLGLSFGTSVAGVATSAMLGLMATLVRREGAQALRMLDHLGTTTLRSFSVAHQRQQSFEALQRQFEVMPAVAQQLQTLIESVERRHHLLDEQLMARHSMFLQQAETAYTRLAQTVEQSLSEGLVNSTRVASEALQPVVGQALTRIAGESTLLHQGLNAALVRFNNGLEERNAQFLDGLQAAQAQAQAERVHADTHQRSAWGAAFEALAQSLQQQWQHIAQQSQAQQQAVLRALSDTSMSIVERSREHTNHSLEAVTRLLQQGDALLQARAAAEVAWVEQHSQRLDALAQLWRTERDALRADEAARGEAAVQRLDALQQALAHQLAGLGATLEEPMARLMLIAAEAPQAATAVIAQLREHMDRLTERDKTNELALMTERAEQVSRITGLLQQVQNITEEQRVAIEHLVTSAAAVLDQVGQQFSSTVSAQALQAQAISEQAGFSAERLTQLVDTFQQGSLELAGSHTKLAQSLQHVESAIDRSMARSDEQLAYYVAQAREVIDLSITAQQGIIENLQRLHENARTTTRVV